MRVASLIFTALRNRTEKCSKIYMNTVSFRAFMLICCLVAFPAFPYPSVSYLKSIFWNLKKHISTGET